MILRFVLCLDRVAPWFDLHVYDDRKRLLIHYTFSIFWPRIEWKTYRAWLPKI